MERYYKKQCLNPPSNISGSPSPSNIPSSHPPPPSNIRSHPLNILSSSQQSEPTELDEILANLHADPGYRRRMLDYPPNYREAIRRHYLQNDPCQPRDHIMPRKVSNKRCFITGWFDRFKWLEYSISKDAAFCRYCYLFKCDFDQMGSTGNDVFTEKGFTNWRKGPENLRAHEGGVGSLHNKAVQQARDLMTQKQHIETFVIKQTDEARNNYHTLLRASLECTRWLLGQGLPFRGHDESLKSSNRGNYLELMHFLSKHNEQVRKVVFENAPKNLKYTSSDIQKDLVHACAIETINAITKDMEGEFFSLLVDGSRDSSTKEQMAVVLRYVNKKGEAIEKFLGVQHVFSTTSSSLEEAIERFFATTNLSMSKLRGQGYDGASNMKGELNGLKTKILNKYPQAFYVHCFAHQLQLALVAVTKGIEGVAIFFNNASILVNTIGSSCKRRDAFREKQQEQIKKALDIGDLETGRGLNQENSLMRPCDTRWNSHYGTIVSIIVMFEAVVEVLEWIKDDTNQDNFGETSHLFHNIQTFDFVFHLFLMRLILGVTNELSQALQKKDQDIVNAMALVEVCKQRLQSLRDDDFGDLLDDVQKFCQEHDIVVPNMEDLHFVPGKSRRKAPRLTNFHYYRVDLYFQVLDTQLKELNDRFNEVNTELLLCMACLSPVNNFASFDKAKIVRLAQLYPQDFDRMDLMNLPIQLDNYIHDMKMHSEFSSLRGIGDLAKELVKTGRCASYILVYKLLTLALVLPVATASVERAFSAMKIVKTPLRNKMGDQWLSDSMLVYIERDVFAFIDNEPIMRRFHGMKRRRQQL
ncbi:uncharacterized protein LOC126601424 [Malus sylvestris]|uniref:uncharacterized protein LOC126601424 n=1 Tax=Malus sylvestris TaxID=3752 RepID=UPI0021ABA9AB|nr:uncharacterized protein LOC126601424 [Malus sylvestris]